jgi:hypothetical protein
MRPHAGWIALVVAACVGTAGRAAAATGGGQPRAAELFVAPDGRDDQPGTKDQPLASLAGARDAVRRIKQGEGPQSITVWLAGGTYRQTQAVVFGLEDSAADGQQITYAALPGQTPVISGGVPVQAWQEVAEHPPGAPPQARGKLWWAPAPQGVGELNVLFDGLGMLPRARVGPLAHTRDAGGWRGGDVEHTTLPLPGDEAARIQPLRGAEVLAIGAAPWTMNILGIESVDAATGLLHLAAPSTYALARPKFGFAPDSIWIENTFAGLDGPGRWLFDPATRRIYVWPRGQTPGEDIVAPADIVAPTTVELLRIEGRIDRDGPADTPVRGLVFRGLTFTHGLRYESAGLSGWGLQHDWERFDSPTALVRLRGAEACAIEQCRLVHTGGSGLRLDLHARRNRIVGNEIAEIGGAGILLAGYGPGLKDVNRDNEITRNHVHRVGRLWWHCIGIWAWQSGHNRIAHNHVHHVPYTGIAVTGRIGWDRSGQAECSRTVRWQDVGAATGGEPWDQRERFLHGRANAIEHNDIHHVMEVMHDGNGIYISGAGRDNAVRGNFLHDVESAAVAEGIRCDDDQNETLIEGNVVWRFGSFGTGICSKGRNHVVNNIVACPRGSVSRGMISLESDHWGDHAGSRIQRNILYAVEPGQTFVWRSIIAQGDPPPITKIDADYNVYFNARDPHAADEYLAWAREHGRETHSLQADPMFENPAAGDFRLKAASPALQLQIQSIELQPGIREER